MNDEIRAKDVEGSNLSSDEVKKAYRDLELFEGRKTAVTHISEQTGIDATTIIKVLHRLSTLTLPHAAFLRLSCHEATACEIAIGDYAFRDITKALILQHANSLSKEGEGGRDQGLPS